MNTNKVMRVVPVLLLGAVLWTAPTQADESSQAADGTVHVVRYFESGPSAVYSSDSGSLGILRLGPVTLPEVRHVDLVVSLTFRYTVTVGDIGRISVSYGRSPNPPFHSMRPKEFPLASPGRKTPNSTTLAWAAKGVPANGATYELFAGANLEKEDCCGSFFTSRVVAVIEASASGAG